MAEKMRGIVLNVRKYNDRNCIVTLYSRERGRISFISPLGSGKASNARRARLQPLAVLDTEVSFKAGAELQRLGSITPAEIWTDIYFNPAKRAVALFLSEFLYRLLNDTMPDARLFDFLVDSFRLLDRMEKGTGDFHIPLLVALLTFSGIQPDVSGWQPGYVFDIASGSFVAARQAKGPVIEGAEAEAVRFVMRINFSNMKRLRLTTVDRRRILYSILNYYSYHFPGLGSLKSPEVLREVFD